jgi:hypothetical protein
MNRRREVMNAYTKLHVGDQQSDLTYWQTQPYQARLAAIEDLRKQFYSWKYNAKPGFQRVYTIVLST